MILHDEEAECRPTVRCEHEMAGHAPLVMTFYPFATPRGRVQAALLEVGKMGQH